MAQSRTWSAMFGAATLIIAICLAADLLPTVSIRQAASRVSSLAWSMRMRARLLTLDAAWRSEEHTSELQSQSNLVCRLLLEKTKSNVFPNLTVRTRIGCA